MAHYGVRFISSAFDWLTEITYSVVDCAEGTLRQFQMQPRGHGEPILKASNVTKLFVTHMHGSSPQNFGGIFIFTSCPSS